MTPETQRLLQHWRHHRFGDIRPFFCQVEAVETVIWLTEVAPQPKNTGRRFLQYLDDASQEANPGLRRLALKLATGAGKTMVMAMLIAWQTINSVRRPQSSRFTRGFLIVTPGLTIKDRLRVLKPNDPDSYYRDRELVPVDLLPASGPGEDCRHQLPHPPAPGTNRGREGRQGASSGDGVCRSILASPRARCCSE